MQTITGERHFESKRFQTVRELLCHCVETYGEQPAYRYHDQPGGQEIVRSYRQFTGDIDAFGTGLFHLGLSGSHIGIIGRNSYEWAIAHNGIINGIGVSVPLDRQLPPSEVVRLCRRGDVRALIYNSQQRAAAAAVAAEVPEIKWFICMNEAGKDQLPQNDRRFNRFDDVLSDGRERLAAGDRSFIDAAIDPEAMSSLIFASGTSDSAKGVMLCHRSITHNIHAVMGTLNIQKGQNALSILPLHHTFENTVGMYMVLAFGCCICFADGFRYFNNNLREWHINILLGVPLIFTTLYNQIHKKLRQDRRLLLIRMLRLCSRMLRVFGFDLRRSVFRPILHALGGGLGLIVCGAAAIDPAIVRFYNDIGIDFYCGYGMTETSPVISVNNASINRYGSVGPPIAGVAVAVDTPGKRPGTVGEILTRSDSIMLGYYNNPIDTAAAMTADGWLRTGDLGYLDRHGCITLTGRCKSMIVLSSGKKAFPEEIEALLDRIPGVRESFVWGEEFEGGLVEICARLAIDRSRLPVEYRESARQAADYLSDQVISVNRQLPAFKEIRYHYVSSRDVFRLYDKIDRQREQQQIKLDMKSHKLDIRKARGQWLD